MQIYKNTAGNCWLIPAIENITPDGIVTELRSMPFGSIVLNVVNAAISGYKSGTQVFPAKLEKDVITLSRWLADLHLVRGNGNTGITDREYIYKMYCSIGCELYGLIWQEPACNGHDLIKDGNNIIPCDTFIVPEQPDQTEIPYLLPSVIYMFSEDLWQLLFFENTPKIRTCANCDRLYFSNNFKAKYCPDCKGNYGKIRYKHRKENSTRALHNSILNQLYLKYGGSSPAKSAGMTSDISNAFLAESNYYWDVVNGRNPQPNPDYNADIQTETDYIRWLESKKAEISRTKKGG